MAENIDIFPEDSASQVMGKHEKLSYFTVENDKYINQSEMSNKPSKMEPDLHIAFDVSFPTLDTIIQNQKTLYLFDSAEKHPRIKTLFGEPNVAFVYSTGHDISKPLRDKYLEYNRKHIKQNLQTIYKRVIANHTFHKQFKTAYNSDNQKGCKYLRIMLPCSSSGFGIYSQLPLKAPQTWTVLKDAICQLIIALCNHDQSERIKRELESKFKEYEYQCDVFTESLSPENQRVQRRMQFELQKKRDEWRLNSYLSFMEQKRAIKRAREKNDEWLQLQELKFHRRIMNDKKLAFEQKNLENVNKLFTEQKLIEKQHKQKSHNLNMQLKLLNDQMMDNQENLDKYIALQQLQNVQMNMIDSHFGNENDFNNKHHIFDNINNNEFKNIIQHSTQIENDITKEMNENNLNNIDDNHETEFYAQMQALESQLNETDKRLKLLNQYK